MRLTAMVARSPPVAHSFDTDRVVVGRSSTATLVLHDPSLSRLHAEFRREGDGWLVADLGSRNGTRINGRDLGAPEPLACGDRIALGHAVLVFEANVPGAISADHDLPVTSGSRAGRGTGRAEDEPLLAGCSASKKELLSAIDRVAGSTATVLLEGESGTGKELAARLIHRRGARRARPFVVVNCPAITGSLFEAELFGIEKGTATGVEPRPGRLELAEGGTLFLDEVADLDAAAQAKLLRFLQDRSVERVGGRTSVRLDVRVVAATNRSLDEAAKTGAFRSDLLHRLDVVRLRLAPLRERREDIPVLVEHFLADGGDGVSLSSEAMTLLERHDWPGNVRELEHAIARARLFAAGDVIQAQDLPPRIGGHQPAGEGDALWRRVVEQGECFWSVVRGPYLRREIPRDAVQALIARARREAGGSYRDVARLFNIEAEHKRLLDFLGRHGLNV